VGKGRGNGGEGVDIAWPDLQLSLRDATAAASGPIGSEIRRCLKHLCLY